MSTSYMRWHHQYWFVVYTTRYRADESVGRACRYSPVVATEAWPNVAATR